MAYAELPIERSKRLAPKIVSKKVLAPIMKDANKKFARIKITSNRPINLPTV